MALPFICDACGQISFVDNLLGLEAPNIRIDNLHISDFQMLQACPHCGGNGHIADGTYEIANGVTRALSLLKLEDLRKLQAVLIAASDSGASTEETAERIAEAVPAAAFLHPLVTQGLVALGVLATITFGLLTYLDPPSSAPPTVIVQQAPLTDKQIAEIAATAARDATAKRPKKEPRERTEHKSRPDDPCWCQSGSKYKHCHGKRRHR